MRVLSLRIYACCLGCRALHVWASGSLLGCLERTVFELHQESKGFVDLFLGLTGIHESFKGFAAELCKT